METFYTPTKNGIDLRVRLNPGAGANRIENAQVGADGNVFLKCAVTQIAEDGKANKALIALLAKEWKLAKSCFEVRRPTTSRNKVLSLDGDSKALAQMLDAWANTRK